MIRKVLTFISFLSLLIVLTTPITALAANAVSLTPSNRVSLLSSYPDQKRGSIEVLRVSYNLGNHSEAITLLNFDISAVPANATIASANLVLTVLPNSDNQGVTLTFERISQGWTQQSVTWNTKPNTAGTSYSVLPVEYTQGAQDYAKFDITDLLKDWLANRDSTHGFQIKGPNNITFNKDYDAHSDGYPPRLELEYTSLPQFVGTATMEAHLYTGDSDDNSDNSEGSTEQEATEPQDNITEQPQETQDKSGQDSTSSPEETPANDTQNPVANSFAQVLTPDNIKIAAITIFLGIFSLVLLKILISKK